MISIKDMNLEKLVRLLLNTSDHPWRKEVELEVKSSTMLCVKYEDVYLRYSKGPYQHYFWDVYGDDFQSPELAFYAILHAPPPPISYRDGIYR